MIKSGTLYVTATPIGNLGDITLRALEVLRSVDWIAAEDTRHTMILLERYGIKARLESLNADAEAGKTPKLIEKLAGGETGAVVSDAGTPGSSDPGGKLVAAAAAAGIPVSPIPGASAIAAALSVSGLSSSRFVFEGFLPRSGKKRDAVISAHRFDERPFVFFESARRVVETLKYLYSAWGDREIILFRELTKNFEEIVRTCLADVEKGKIIPKELGEYTVLIKGTEEREEEDGLDAGLLQRTAEALSALSATPSSLAATLSAITGVSRNRAYKMLEEMKKEK